MLNFIITETYKEMSELAASRVAIALAKTEFGDGITYRRNSCGPSCRNESNG